jgi:D-3-phosphoglycerate dehydrogenase / 2-oxoglutarate reductase
MRILLTTTSYQDTPGRHHDLLEASGFEVVRARGPLTEAQLLELIEQHDGFDGLLNGDDQITARVIDAALPKLRVIAKYGIGLDSIDVAHATVKKVPVLFTPGVNHTTVAEHAFGLMISLVKSFWPHLRAVKGGEWQRQTGRELFGKTLGILGLGRIGREVVRRARAFGMPCVGYDLYWPEDFAQEFQVQRLDSIEQVLGASDIVTLHLNLTDDTRQLIDEQRLGLMRDGAYLINTARGGLIDEVAVAAACQSGKLAGYGADVLCQEPMQSGHPFQSIDNSIVTPHIGSRTFESVERQAVRATTNIVEFLSGGTDYIQANEL